MNSHSYDFGEVQWILFGSNKGKFCTFNHSSLSGVFRTVASHWEKNCNVRVPINIFERLIMGRPLQNNFVVLENAQKCENI